MSASFPLATVRAYQRTMSLGVQEFAEGRWSEARALFLRGHGILPNARSFRVLGMTAFNLKYYPVALRELSEALRDVRRPLNAALRSETEGLRDRAQAFVGRYRVRLEPAGAELRIDGQVAKRESDGSLLLAVGEHALEAEAPGHELLSRVLRVEGGDSELLFLRLRALARPKLSVSATGLDQSAAGRSPQAQRPRSDARGVGARVFGDYRWTWVAGASALALGSATLALHLQARAEERSLRAQCEHPGDCVPWIDETEKLEKLYHRTDSLAFSTLALSLATVAIALVEWRVALRTSARVLR